MCLFIWCSIKRFDCRHFTTAIIFLACLSSNNLDSSVYVSVGNPQFFVNFSFPVSYNFKLAMFILMLPPFLSCCEGKLFFRVVTTLKHSSLSRQTVAFWKANTSNFDSSASIEASTDVLSVLQRGEKFAVHGRSKMVVSSSSYRKWPCDS